jgi:hypothetical protein
VENTSIKVLTKYNLSTAIISLKDRESIFITLLILIYVVSFKYIPESRTVRKSASLYNSIKQYNFITNSPELYDLIEARKPLFSLISSTILEL